MARLHEFLLFLCPEVVLAQTTQITWRVVDHTGGLVRCAAVTDLNLEKSGNGVSTSFR